MKGIAQLTDKEYQACLNDIADLIKEAEDYFESQTFSGEAKPDYDKVHRYLDNLSPYADHPAAPPDLLKLVAWLYFEEARYQEAAELYQRVNDQTSYFMLGNINFYSGYDVGLNSWKDRQERIWSIFQSLEQGLRKVTTDNVVSLRGLMDGWDSCFPTREVMVMGPSDGKKGEVCLGLPDGIFSLFPMLYLQNHVPDTVARKWNVVLEAADHDQKECLLGDRIFPANEVRVDIVSAKSLPNGAQTRDSNKVVLTVWHPYLRDLGRMGRGREAMQSAVCCVNACLPQSARLLYVDCIALADREPPKIRSFPVPELTGQFEARNMAVDIPLNRVLERRRRRFTREPIRSARPRTDITHGETSMPEMEEMYFLRDEVHLKTMQRYGTCGWFLMIPRKVCEGEFQEFRKVLEDAARAELGDAVQFVGWAEGTKNYYLDLVTVHGRGVLDCFRKSFAGVPECKSIRCSTFYWNSGLCGFNYLEELKKLTKAEFTGPVEELVGEKLRPALEKLVSTTQWEEPDIPKPNVQWDVQEGSVAFMDDPADLTKAYEMADGEEDEDPHAQFGEFFVNSPDDEDDDDDEEDDFILYDDPFAELYHRSMEDPQFAAAIKKLAEIAAAGPPGKQQPDTDDDDVRLIPPGEYGSYLANPFSTGKYKPPKPVHNTKRKGLSRKKDKNKRKKKK